MIKPERAMTPSITKIEKRTRIKKSEETAFDRKEEVKKRIKNLSISKRIKDKSKLRLCSRNKMTIKKNKNSTYKLIERKGPLGARYWDVTIKRVTKSMKMIKRKVRTPKEL